MKEAYMSFITDKTIWTITLYGYIGLNLIIGMGVFFKYIESKLSKNKN